MSDDERYEPVPLGFGIEAPPPSYKAAISKKNEALFKVRRVCVHVCMCVCACVYEREGEREWCVCEREREGERVVCVCV